MEESSYSERSGVVAPHRPHDLILCPLRRIIFKSKFLALQDFAPIPKDLLDETSIFGVKLWIRLALLVSLYVLEGPDLGVLRI